MEQTSLIYAALALFAVGLGMLYAALLYWSPEAIVTHESEKKYRSRASPTKSLPLTRLEDAATHDLTIVIPAFNEVARLPGMMESTIKHLSSAGAASRPAGLSAKTNGTANGAAKPNGKRSAVASTAAAVKGDRRTVEIIIVDDGSTDKTSETALQLAKKYADCDIRVVTLEKNIGKGGAVRHGMLHAGGERLLMADADGASRIEDLEELWKVMDDIAPGYKPGVVVGSRAHLVKSDAVVKRSLLRNILMYGFHTILRVLGVGYIRDTQCGFKLFSRAAAQGIFPAQHLPTWIFDVELLLLANELGMPIAEVPVEWHEVPGSKLNVITASLQMLRDLLIVRANHLLGRWTTAPVKVKTE